MASLYLPVGIAAAKSIPGLWAAYPLLLPPLLLAGPLAVRGLPCRPALAAAALAGLVSALVATCSFSAAWLLFGDWYWGLTSAAGAAPMPPLPRLTILPTAVLTWAHQDLLVFQPLLALLLGAAALGARALGRRFAWIGAVVAPIPLSGRLRLTFGALIVMLLALGVVSFGTIEEMHILTHRTQIRADWQRQLGIARAALDEEVVLRAQGGPSPDAEGAAARAARVDRAYQALASTAPRTGLSGGRDEIIALLAVYRPALDHAIAAHANFRAGVDGDADQPARLAAAVGALGTLQQEVGSDLIAMLAGGDLSHHQRLIVVMGLIAALAGISLWLCERVFRSIEAPMMALAAHVRRVARGDFTGTLPADGPTELRTLAQSVNRMTADLDRLYQREREQRALAEAVARREHELSAAKEFWTNTLVHDMKTPLSLIAGWTDVLEHGRPGHLTGAQHEVIDQIRQATKMLEELVVDINDSFRLQAEALPLHRAAVAPADLLHVAVTEFRGPDRAAPDLRLEPGVGPVLADARLVGRVLHNLIGNAHKHGGPRVRVTLVAEPSAGGVRFAVDDDGPGIPVAERERVFARFVQGAGAVRGSGLGLAFCKLVVEQLGGRIWAEASPYGGARLAFELPAAAAELPVRGQHDPDARPVSAPRVA